MTDTAYNPRCAHCLSVPGAAHVDPLPSTRRPHYPGDYAHVARCQKCTRDIARIQRAEDEPRRAGQASYDDWYDSEQDSSDLEQKGSKA